MSDRTGLGVLEIAALRATSGLNGVGNAFTSSAQVLDVLAVDGLGPDYLYPVLQDLAVPWKRHLTLLEVQGNFGSPGSDPAADARYTEVRLSPIGRLALRSERGEVGPVPLDLIDGTAYCGGRVPPFSPIGIASTLSLLVARGDDAFSAAEADTLIGGPMVPTGAVIDGGVMALLRGEPARMRMSSRITATTDSDRTVLEITGYPLGVSIDRITDSIADRSRWPDRRRGGGRDLVADVQDHSTERSGVRVLVALHHGVDAAEAELWLRGIWPVSIEVDWQLPAPMAQRVFDAAAAIRSSSGGLRELRSLL